MTRKPVRATATKPAVATPRDAKASATQTALRAGSAPAKVVVRFGTNRARGNPVELFSAEFRDTSDGAAYVTGSIEVNAVGGQWRVDPTTLTVDPVGAARGPAASIPDAVTKGPRGAEQFSAFAARRGRRAAVGARRNLVFLPGFNNTFVSSMESAAQLAAGYRAPEVICFAWPSQGAFGVGPYLKDRSSAERSGAAIALALAHLMAPLADAEAGPTLDLLGHSMGAHALAAAVQVIDVSAPQLLTRTYFETALLMAADEDDDALDKPHALKHLLTLANHIDVYANRHDEALLLSGVVNHRGALGLFGPRALAALPERVIWVNATVAADREDTSGTGHQYYRLSAMTMNDARQVLSGQAPDAVAPRHKDPDPIFAGRRFTIGDVPD